MNNFQPLIKLNIAQVDKNQQDVIRMRNIKNEAIFEITWLLLKKKRNLRDIIVFTHLSGSLPVPL